MDRRSAFVSFKLSRAHTSASDFNRKLREIAGRPLRRTCTCHRFPLRRSAATDQSQCAKSAPAGLSDVLAKLQEVH